LEVMNTLPCFFMVVGGKRPRYQPSVKWASPFLLFDLALGDGEELGLALAGAARGVAVVLDELGDEQALLARHHALDVGPEAVVVAHGDRRAVVLVGAQLVEVMGAAELGVAGVTNDVEELLVLGAADVAERPVPAPHVRAGEGEHAGTDEGGEMRALERVLSRAEHLGTTPGREACWSYHWTTGGTAAFTKKWACRPASRAPLVAPPLPSSIRFDKP
jgi:hypothetical protein